MTRQEFAAILAGMGTKLVIDMAELGKAGGQARAKKLTPAKRKRIAKEAAGVRWNRAKGAK